MTEVAPGVIADVAVRVMTVDTEAATAVVRVVDNNYVPILGNATLPIGIIRPTQFPTAVWDVLQSTKPTQETAVVRWVSANGQLWSESPTGSPARQTIGWQKIGTFTPPP